MQWLYGAASGAPTDTTQIGVLVTLLGSVGAILTVVIKVIRDGRRREQGEGSLLELQREELLEPLRQELRDARDERDRARAERDRAHRQRRALITELDDKHLPIPPEAYQ